MLASWSIFLTINKIYSISQRKVNSRVAPDTDLAGYPANIFTGYPVNSNIEFFFLLIFPKKMYLHLVFNKSAYGSVIY